ncbi:hypothetical protein BGZ72_005818 [Mortierella alpina]|nr:hypothetical protein BGZ72_005818 [Mortierella alpina]
MHNNDHYNNSNSNHSYRYNNNNYNQGNNNNHESDSDSDRIDRSDNYSSSSFDSQATGQAPSAALIAQGQRQQLSWIGFQTYDWRAGVYPPTDSPAWDWIRTMDPPISLFVKRPDPSPLRPPPLPPWNSLLDREDQSLHTKIAAAKLIMAFSQQANQQAAAGLSEDRLRWSYAKERVAVLLRTVGTRGGQRTSPSEGSAIARFQVSGKYCSTMHTNCRDGNSTRNVKQYLGNKGGSSSKFNSSSKSVFSSSCAGTDTVSANLNSECDSNFNETRNITESTN